MNLFAIALMTLFASASPAPASPGSVSVVGIGSCTQGRLDGYVRGLREALWKRLDAAVQSDEEAIRRLGGMSRSSLADVDRVFSAARYDIDSMAFERAEQTLKLAAADLLALPPSPERWKRLRDVYTLLAWASLKLEKQEEAEEIFAKILRVEPTFALERKQFPPSTVRLVEKVRASVAAKATASLSITTRPAALPVFVDGRDVGKSPVAAKVPPGEYRVEVGFGEGRGIPRTVKVESAEKIELEDTFEGAIHPLAGPCISTGPQREGRLGALVRLASVLGTRIIVAVSSEEHGSGERYLVATIVDSVTGQEAREARVKLYPSGPPSGAFERLADFLATGDVAPPLEAVRGAQTVTKAEKAGKTGTTGKTWETADLEPVPLIQPGPTQAEGAQPEGTAAGGRTYNRLRIASYALTGVAVIAGGVSPIFFVKASSAYSDMDKLKTPSGAIMAGRDPEYFDLRNRGDRNRTIGIALAATCGVALAGAATTFILSTRNPDPPVSVALGPGGGTLQVRF